MYQCWYYISASYYASGIIQVAVEQSQMFYEFTEKYAEGVLSNPTLKISDNLW